MCEASHFRGRPQWALLRIRWRRSPKEYGIPRWLRVEASFIIESPPQRTEQPLCFFLKASRGEQNSGFSLSLSLCFCLSLPLCKGLHTQHCNLSHDLIPGRLWLKAPLDTFTHPELLQTLSFLGSRKRERIGNDKHCCCPPRHKGIMTRLECEGK